MSGQQFELEDKQGRQGPNSELDLLEQVIEPPKGDSFLSKVKLGLGFLTKAERYQQVERYRKGIYADAALADDITELAIKQTEYELGEETWNGLEEDHREALKSQGELAEDVKEEIEEAIDERTEQLRQLRLDMASLADQRPEFYDETVIQDAINAVRSEALGLKEFSDDTLLSRRECILLLGRRRLWTEFSDQERLNEVRRRTGVKDWVPPHWRILMMAQDISRSQDAELVRGITGRVQEKKIEGTTEKDKKRGIARLRGSN